MTHLNKKIQSVTSSHQTHFGYEVMVHIGDLELFKRGDPRQHAHQLTTDWRMETAIQMECPEGPCVSFSSASWWLLEVMSQTTEGTQFDLITCAVSGGLFFTDVECIHFCHFGWQPLEETLPGTGILTDVEFLWSDVDEFPEFFGGIHQASPPDVDLTPVSHQSPTQGYSCPL